MRQPLAKVWKAYRMADSDSTPNLMEAHQKRSRADAIEALQPNDLTVADLPAPWMLCRTDSMSEMVRRYKESAGEPVRRALDIDG